MVRLGMMVVGLTGGLASGKTTVARLFQACGAYIIDADYLARKVVEPRKAAWRDIVEEFGKKVLNSDRTINRQALAEIVFTHPAKLKRLQRIIHPRVAREQAKSTTLMKKNHPHAVIMYDAAMLIEAGAHKRMDHVIVVKADRKTQLERACRRDGLTKTHALRRIRQQMPLREKLRYADTVIDGTAPKGQLRRTVQSLYRTFQQKAQRK